MSSHDPFPELQGFMADQDVALREQAYRELVQRPCLGPSGHSGPAIAAIRDLLKKHPRGPRLVSTIDPRARVDRASFCPTEDGLASMEAWGETTGGRRVLCTMTWGRWESLTCLEFAFARHLVKMASAKTTRQRLVQFKTQIAGLPTAQAWF